MHYGVTLVPNPKTADDLEKAIRDFIFSAGRDENNQILIYYAGHGLTVPLEDYNVDVGYMIPTEAAPYKKDNPDPFMKSAVSFDILTAQMANIRARHAFFVFDSCFSGEIFRALALRSYTGRRPQGPARSDRTSAAAVARPEDDGGTAGDELLQYFLQRPVRWFLTAAGPEQKSPDDSVFCDGFVRGLRGGVKGRHAGFVTSDEISTFVETQVTSVLGPRQVPAYGPMGGGGAWGKVFFRVP
jgi:hypothetical protein